MTCIAFFGATGGCTLACLALCLEAGYECTALVRSSAKLQKLLVDRHISDATLAARLTIFEGDIRDVDKVGKALAAPRKTSGGDPQNNATDVVDIIISGIGGTPVFTPNPLRPSLDDPTICQDGIATILSALRAKTSARRSPKPFLAALSTTGISAQKRDVPLAMIPMYHWLLAVPHKDKKEMEALLQAETAKPAEQRVIQDFLTVRPSFLTNGERRGSGKLRVGRRMLRRRSRWWGTLSAGRMWEVGCLTRWSRVETKDGNNGGERWSQLPIRSHVLKARVSFVLVVLGLSRPPDASVLLDSSPIAFSTALLISLQ